METIPHNNECASCVIQVRTRPCGATQQVVRKTVLDRGCRYALDGTRDGDRRSLVSGTKAGYAGNGLSMEK